MVTVIVFLLMWLFLTCPLTLEEFIDEAKSAAQDATLLV